MLIIIGVVSCSAIQKLKPVEQPMIPIIIEDTSETTSETSESIEITEETFDSAEVNETSTTIDDTAGKELYAEPTISKSMYDTLTANELFLLEATVQHEVGAFSKEYKTYIAELLYNRLVSDDYPDTVVEMLFQDGQFTGIDTWICSGIVVDDETKAVVKEVFTNENPSHDCIAYYNPELSAYEAIIWFEYSGDVEYVFSHTETDWGIEYETRFFR